MDYNKNQPLGEAYTCLQGEGKYMGIPHILLRVTGCRLRCQFSDSFCDTPYASWAPEKGKYTLNDVVEFYENNKHIKHTMITGGGPTIHSELLKELCIIGKTYNHTITIETEGSEFVQTVGDLISLSPKLSNSSPQPGSYMPYAKRKVTQKDLDEVKELQHILDIPNNKVWLMPEGLVVEQLNERRRWLMELCTEHGYNYTDRLHIIAYGDTRGV